MAGRKLRHQGLMVDVPEGEGVYHFRKLLDAHPEAPPAVAVDPDEFALFQYTGGTTGIPKAAMLSTHSRNQHGAGGSLADQPGGR